LWLKIRSMISDHVGLTACLARLHSSDSLMRYSGSPRWRSGPQHMPSLRRFGIPGTLEVGEKPPSPLAILRKMAFQDTGYVLMAIFAGIALGE
jgi:hypothetical protein